MFTTAHQKLDEISKLICSLRDVEERVFDELQSKISKLLIQVEIQKGFNEIARTIRNGKALPVRRINYNIKKLSEDDDVCQLRWSALRKLNCQQIIFSTLAFSGLASLADEQFACLVENVSSYIEVQELPCGWIARDQIRRVVAGTPRRGSTQPFLQDYHSLELRLGQDSRSIAIEEKALARQCKRREAGKSPSSINNAGRLEGSARKRKRGAGQESLPGAAVVNQAESVSSPVLSLVQTSTGLRDDREGAGGKTHANLSASFQARSGCQVEAGETNIAMMAEVDKLGNTLGGYLFDGMDASKMRKGEKDEGMTTFTDTVRLHLAYEEGEDFKLEIWLSCLIGKAVSQANTRSIEDMRAMLGEFLFKAMDASNRRQEEEKRAITSCTSAVKVSLHDSEDGSDCKVEVMLGFGAGLYIFEKIYPGVD